MRGLGDADARGEARQQSASLWILPDRDDIRDIKTELLDVYQAESRMSLGSVGNMSTTEKILLGAHSGVQAQSQHILTEAEENSLLSSFTESCTVSQLSEKLLVAAQSSRKACQDARLAAFLVCARKFFTCDNQADVCSKQTLLRSICQEWSLSDVPSLVALERTAGLISEVCLHAILAESGTQQTSNGVSVTEAAAELPALALLLMFRSVKQLQSLSEGLTLKLLHACRHIVHASEVLFLSERWLACTTLEKFTATVNGLRHAHRECLIGLLNALASEDGMPDLVQICQHLLVIGKTAADIIAGRCARPQPKELRSFGVLNTGVVNAVKVYLKLPESMPELHVSGRLLGRLLLENLQYSFDVYLTDPQQDHLQVVRFWMQHTLKLMSAHPQTVHSHLEGFVSAAQSLFNLLHSARSVQLQDEWMKEATAAANRLSLTLCHSITAACLTPKDTPGAVQTMLRCHSQPDEVQRSTSIGHVLLLLKLLRAAKTMPQALMSATAQALPHIFDAAADCMCLETFTAVACLSSEFRDAVSLFAADTCKRSSAGGAAVEAWNHCQQSLFKAACKPHPFGIFLLMRCWHMLIRKGTAQQAQTHLTLLDKIGTSLAGLAAGSTERPYLPPVASGLQEVLASLIQAAPEGVRASFIANLQADMERMHPPLPASAAVVGFRVKALSLAAIAESVPGISECCRRWLEASRESVHRDLAAEDCLRRESQGSLAWRLSCMAEIVSFLHPAQGDQLPELALEVLRRTESLDPLPTFANAAMDYLLALLPCNPSSLLTRALPLVCSLAKHVQLRGACAAFARACGPLQPVPAQLVELFHILFQDDHWLLRHETMEALVGLARSTATTDLLQFVPRSTFNPGSGQEQPFAEVLEQYVKRTPYPGSAAEAQKRSAVTKEQAQALRHYADNAAARFLAGPKQAPEQAELSVKNRQAASRMQAMLEAYSALKDSLHGLSSSTLDPTLSERLSAWSVDVRHLCSQYAHDIRG